MSGHINTGRFDHVRSWQVKSDHAGNVRSGKDWSGQGRTCQVTLGQDDVRSCHVMSGQIRSGYVRS